ncbi:MAG: UDP-N-acetylglucosamine 1-carboxyvinyltransferase [Clostridia bacterium]|nr:UDP-N-acetylglucosamine 1-carboxyvinyltransferase [Clostridia bacterium]
MTKIIVRGGKQLRGEVKIKGAKNSVLPLFAAAVLTQEEVTVHNVPELSDVKNMLRILDEIGAETFFENGTAKIRAKNICKNEIPVSLARVLRSSFFLLGSVLSRTGGAKVAYPGGCDIGLRPIDLHIKALRDLGVLIEEVSGYVVCDNARQSAGEVVLDYPSVGATENVILSSVLTPGTTVLHNAACEPEIVDLQRLLNKMGASVSGAGTPVIKVVGVDSLHGAEHTAIPDRIAAGTYALAAAITGGEITLLGADPTDMRALLSKLAKTSCIISQSGDIIRIKGRERTKAVDLLTTRPHPGFPTDLQAHMMALMTVSEGTSVFCEKIFENRFRHVGELIKMGANITVDGRTAVVTGVPRLHGAEVEAQDLRGGAALVLAGLNARGETTICNVEHIDRGYERIEEVFSDLGADIRRV